MPPPPVILRNSQKRSSRKRIVGTTPGHEPLPERRLPLQRLGVDGDLVRLEQLVEQRVSAKDGISVVKSRAASPSGATLTACFKRPWIAVPVDVIDSTFPALICWTKNGLYGTRAR